MMKCIALMMMLAMMVGAAARAADDEHHSHPVPEKLGRVQFPISCAAAVRPGFERAMALLHSFAYSASEQAFREVLERDPACTIARWGIAMTLYHQLWEPPAAAELRQGSEQLQQALESGAGTVRERQFIEALASYYRDSDSKPHAMRAAAYAQAMAEVARSNPNDVEAQIFYALALIATAAPADKTHASQKMAVAILEPLYAKYPQHPGLAHYLIHACDSTELAPQGLAAARAYSKIAPSAPHALHMPSHVFTRLGYWDDSIASNLAARQAAHDQGDVGEELHAMDYLTYAYLQRGRFTDAEQVIVELRSMKNPSAAQFKVGYAATAMPVRLAVERGEWSGTLTLEPLPQSSPQVAALVYWARALGDTRGPLPQSPDADIERLQMSLQQLQAAANGYWAAQVDVLLKEAQAWRTAAADPEAALAGMRAAAEEEDAVEKLPVTPGPIVPAREQLGELLLQLNRNAQALKEFQAALLLAPRRRGALLGAMTAAERLGDPQTAAHFKSELTAP